MPVNLLFVVPIRNCDKAVYPSISDFNIGLLVAIGSHKPLVTIGSTSLLITLIKKCFIIAFSEKCETYIFYENR